VPLSGAAVKLWSLRDGHLATSYVREVIRAAKPLGISEAVNVVPIARAR
jgi:hypothetical protein